MGDCGDVAEKTGQRCPGETSLSPAENVCPSAVSGVCLRTKTQPLQISAGLNREGNEKHRWAELKNRLGVPEESLTEKSWCVPLPATTDTNIGVPSAGASCQTDTVPRRGFGEPSGLTHADFTMSPLCSLHQIWQTLGQTFVRKL